MDTSRRKSRMYIAASTHVVSNGQSSYNSSRGTRCQPRPISQRYFCFQLSIVAVVVINLFQLVVGNPVFVNNPSLAQFQSGRNIRHLPCVVRKSGLSGVCMFAIDCIKANGTHLGTCIDRFYFGSCCQVHDESVILEPEISDNSIDQNTISHFQHESTTHPESGLFKITTPTSTTSMPVTSSSVQEIISSSIQNITTAIRDANATIVPIYSKPRPSGVETSAEISSDSQSSSTSTISSTTTSSVELTATTDSSTVSEMVTTTMSVLTTTAAPERVPVQTTTAPTKVTTFQVVHDELTTITPTAIAPSTTEQTTLPAIIAPPKRPTKKPTVNRTTTHKPTTSINRPTMPPVNSIHTETTKKPTRTTTHKPHVTTTRRTPVKRPTKRPSSSSTNKKPAKRPTTSSSYSNKRNTTKTTTKRPVKLTTTSKVPITTTVLTTFTTRAPRPKPKPTAQIVKVPPTMATEEPVHKESNENGLPTTNLPSTTTTVKVTPTKPATTTTAPPITTATSTMEEIAPVTTQSSSSSIETTTEVMLLSNSISEVGIIATSSMTAPETTIASEISTSGPVQSSSEPSSPASLETTTTFEATTDKPTPLTTSIPETSTAAILTTVSTFEEMTTMKPGLVTWTTIDESPTNISAAENDGDNWSPPPAADWVPLVTISPFINSSTGDIQNVSVLADEITGTTDGVENVSSTQLPTNPMPESTLSPMDSTTVAVQTSTQMADNSQSTTIGGVDLTMEGVVVSDFATPEAGLNETIALGNVSSSTAPSVSFEGIDYKQICGKRMFPEPRIVGGSNAAFGRWPWQISLRQWRTSTYLHKCGAALLNENWAITAAHCVDNVPPSDLLLRLGEYDLAEEEEPYGYQERRVQIVASHPQFDPRTFEYDLALLRFYEPVTFQPNIIPVCVPEDDVDFIGQTAYVTGWGRLYEDGPLPSVLQEVSVPIINNTICETMYRNAGYIEHIPNIFICAGWKKGGYDSCEGDSGGPMVLQRDDKRFLLGGVISWGIGCAEPNQPGVYTRISEFRDWINQILQF